MVNAAAPTRISFAGGGTDMPEVAEKIGGCVTSVSINRYIRVSLKKRSDKKICIESVGMDKKHERTMLTEKTSYTGKLGLIKAVAEEMNSGICGFDIKISSDVPHHSGLGASGAAFVALIGSFNCFYSLEMEKKEIAELAFKLERERLGNMIGRQDQYAAAFGGLNFIEFRKNGTEINRIKIRKNTLHELENGIVLVHIAKRSGAAGDIISNQMKIFHVNEENFMKTKELGLEAKKTLEGGDLEAFGSVLSDAWKYKKMFGSVTTGFIDKIYDTAVKNGAYGGKLSGAGGGGCGFFFCRSEKKSGVIKALESMGAKNLPFSFDFSGLRTDADD